MKSGIRWLLFAVGVMLGASLLAQADMGNWLLTEPQRWKVAEAENLWLSGERQEAIDHLKATLEKAKPELVSLDQLARWALIQEDFETVHWTCDQADAQAERASQPLVAFPFARHRSFALYRQRKPQEALQCWEEFADADGLAETSEFLNGYAYIRALVGLELDQAAAQADQVLAEYGWTDVDVQHRLGLARFDSGQDRQALVHFDRALQRLEPQLKRFNVDFERQVGALILAGSMKDSKTRRELSQLRVSRDRMHQRWLMLHAHRALAYERLSQAPAAAADREEITRMGYSRDELDALRYQDNDLTGYAAVLDTRGWIRFRAGEFELAVRDLEQAAACAEAGLQALQSQYDDSVKRIVHSEELQDQWHEQRRGVAVIHDHWAQALYELGQLEQAASAEEKVRQLGFEVGPHLY